MVLVFKQEKPDKLKEQDKQSKLVPFGYLSSHPLNEGLCPMGTGIQERGRVYACRLRGKCSALRIYRRVYTIDKQVSSFEFLVSSKNIEK